MTKCYKTIKYLLMDWKITQAQCSNIVMVQSSMMFPIIQ
jgi:hypothetical protein